MESITLTSENRSEYISKLSKFLLLLSNVDKKDINKKIYFAEEVLFTIFDIEINLINLLENEKKKIGPLIIKSLRCIEECIDNETLNFLTSTISSACFLRSGVQFLIDNYENYFDNEDFDLETVAKTIKQFEIDLDLQDIDHHLKSYTFHDYDYFPEEDIARVKEKLEKINVKNHPWWYEI